MDKELKKLTKATITCECGAKAIIVADESNDIPVAQVTGDLEFFKGQYDSSVLYCNKCKTCFGNL